MRILKHISIVLFGVVVVMGASAQMRNPPPASIYSMGASTLGGPPASIYSLPSRPIYPGRTCCAVGIQVGHGGGHHRGGHNRYGYYGYGGIGGYYYPVYPYYGTDIESYSESLPNAGTFNRAQPAEDVNRAAPTVFDRGYRPEDSSRYGQHYTDSRESSAQASAPTPSPAPEPSPSVATVLIFRDGHRQEVQNYAIMGSTLFVLTPERRKIALADLNLEATTRENDDRGVDFRVPPTAE